MAFPELMQALKAEVLGWCGDHPHLPAQHFLAVQRMTELQARPVAPATILTSISRAVDQKMLILKSVADEDLSALHAIMRMLDADGCYILLASGDEAYHRFLTRAAAQYPNLVFLNGYSGRCAELLYANGDLFLMPSSYEPCGISQMLAMRDGQPCVAHAVGGLKDTIQHNRNGFLFEGDTLHAQVLDFLKQVAAALEIKRTAPPAWEKIHKSAGEARFEWIDSARQYMQTLYGLTRSGHESR